MTLVLPAADWADDALRPALNMILRRLDKVFLKIAKKPSIRVIVLLVFLVLRVSELKVSPVLSSVPYLL